jgi:hypothetical protein
LWDSSPIVVCQFANLICHTASPQWNFDDATFDRSAASCDNPDHVDIVVHNYRLRLGLGPGESQYDDLEKQLATGPVIPVPTITVEGDANGAPNPEPSAYATTFSGGVGFVTVRGRQGRQQQVGNPGGGTARAPLRRRLRRRLEIAGYGTPSREPSAWEGTPNDEALATSLSITSAVCRPPPALPGGDQGGVPADLGGGLLDVLALRWRWILRVVHAWSAAGSRR